VGRGGDKTNEKAKKRIRIEERQEGGGRRVP
jgi:hypothetical protein